MEDYDDDKAKKPPRRSLDLVLGRQNWVREHLRVYLGTGLDIDIARKLAIQINTASDDTMPYEHLYGTFTQYEGTALTEAFVETLSMQLAGREDELVEGPLFLYSHPIREEWVPLEVVSMTPRPWRDNEPGVEMQFLALGGHPAGHTLTKAVPERWLNFLAYQIGFSRRNRYPELPWTFVGLRLWGYLVPDFDQSVLQFENWGVSDELKSYNTKIVRYRVRFFNNRGVEDPYCPMEYDHDCCDCKVRSDKCPGAMIRTR